MGRLETAGESRGRCTQGGLQAGALVRRAHHDHYQQVKAHCVEHIDHKRSDAIPPPTGVATVSWQRCAHVEAPRSPGQIHPKIHCKVRLPVSHCVVECDTLQNGKQRHQRAESRSVGIHSGDGDACAHCDSDSAEDSGRKWRARKQGFHCDWRELCYKLR